MSEQLERLVGPAEAQEFARRAEQIPVLITEAEVAFSTTAAVPLRRAATGWWTWASRAALAVRQTFAGLVVDERPAPRHHPKRYRYLEDARMGREMGRL
jgi:hypothetical protein